jgi:hypothetical protein
MSASTSGGARGRPSAARDPRQAALDLTIAEVKQAMRYRRFSIL